MKFLVLIIIIVKTFSATTWRVLDYQNYQNTMVYGSIATGYVAGGFTEMWFIKKLPTFQ